MDIHPIVVHFPIAFLTLYGLLELVRFQKVIDQPHWFYTKGVLVIAGALGALAAALTGAIASGWAIGGPRLFAMHQIFALLVIIVSIVPAVAYALRWAGKFNLYTEHVMKPKSLVSLAILILIVITITGGLGGAMVYGTHFDPLMAPIFKLLGVY